VDKAVQFKNSCCTCFALLFQIYQTENEVPKPMFSCFCVQNMPFSGAAYFRSALYICPKKFKAKSVQTLAFQSLLYSNKT
jgi:hypothetical protein